MGVKGNTVNMQERSGSYHHGDLRAALVEAGLRLLAERSGDGLGLREVARAVGVSATSVYRHFPDKTALLEALAAEGLARLAAAQRSASEAAGGGTAGFSASGTAYVRFALANPALFRMIFANPGARTAAERDDDAIAMLRDNAATLAAGNGGNAEVVMLKAWALAHGLAMLMLDQQVPADDKIIDDVVTAAGL
ncbi:TetR family transcriptional regulator [Sphingomonas sp. DOAB1063]|uniref:TetR family transcriptional regulator n=2 Tax=Sphingomonas albertensis TaxID=2762591 RepID=A0ABR7AI24_9SPHN|nr:TetR family transcriptional regulator [Sphingomonas albertensis]